MFSRVRETGSASRNLVNKLVRLKDLKKLWQPYLSLMKLFGLLNFRKKDSNKLSFYIWNLYSVILLLLTWTNVVYRFVRCFSTKLEVDGNFIYATSVLCWNLSMAIARTNLFVASNRASGFPQFLKHWTELKFDPKYVDVIQKRTSLFTREVLVFTLCLVLLKVFVFFVGCYTLGGAYMYKWIFFIERSATIYNSVVDVIVMGCFFLTCLTVGKVFVILNEQLEEQVFKDAIDIELFHAGYHGAIELMENADNCWTLYSGFVIVNNLISTASLTYLQMHHTQSTWLEFAYTVYWMVDGMACMVLTCYLASTIHTKAHLVLHTLYKIPVLRMPLNQQAQVISLQMRLSNSTAGFTLFGIQVVTKGLLPTIVSGFASYLFLLVQFQQPKGCLKPCNDTLVPIEII